MVQNSQILFPQNNSVSKDEATQKDMQLKPELS